MAQFARESTRALTREQAFEALVRFTVKMRDLGWPSLPGLLGGMQPIGGAPSDPGAGEDWAEVVALAAPTLDPSDGDRFSSDAAYEAAFRFLAHQFQHRGIDSLQEVIDRLHAIPSDSRFKEVAVDWQAALSQPHSD